MHYMLKNNWEYSIKIKMNQLNLSDNIMINILTLKIRLLLFK